MIDKAKAYDEALEKARKQRDDYQKELDKTDKNSQLASLLRAGISAVEMIFPQLKENEDERIRKDIIDHFESIKSRALYDNQEESDNIISSCNEKIAYLEKQKKHQETCTKFLAKILKHSAEGFRNVLKKKGIDYIPSEAFWTGTAGTFSKQECNEFYKWMADMTMELVTEETPEYKKGFKDGLAASKKEQKPVDDKAFEEWIDDWFKEHKEKAYPQITMDEKEFKNFCRGIRNMYQQKSDWNEEDEEMIKTIIDVLERSSQVTTYEQRGGLMSALVGCSDIYKKEIEWLKDISLNHKKFNEAVDKLCSNEWSEEDEKDIAHIIEILDDCYAFGRHDLSKTNHENLVNKLKSLRSQPKKELSIEKAIQWLDDTFYFLDNSSGRGRDYEITTHDFDSLEEMYDSFRKAVTVDSQPTWKPTEEQMDALKNVAYGTYQNGDGPVLRELHKQLNKLGVKEEPEYYQHFDPDC